MSDPIDSLITGMDRALRTLTGQYTAQRPNPAQVAPEGELDPGSREHAAGLMRVNHAGEICAQALYEGQALTAKSPEAKAALEDAAMEERDHLHWCRQRLAELDAKPSVFDPIFYAASYALGAVTGLAGDKVSLGFVEATEDRVVQHLDEHMALLPEDDERSRAILDQMREDETRHGEQALAMGGDEFPQPVKSAMAVVAKIMTTATYRL